MGLVEKKPTECSKCGETRRKALFRMKTRGPPPMYDDVCYLCHIDEEGFQKLDKVRKKREEERAEKARKEKERRAAEIARRRAYRDDTVKRERQAITNQKKAQAELAKRELAQRKLIHFVERFVKKYQAGWVHKDICERLERFVKAVEAGESPRLMLFMPPRHGKSEIASNCFPAWLLGRHPDWEVMATSYGASLPIKFSRRVRSLLRSSEYQAIFETRLDRENENVEGWSTVEGGSYTPAGVGGGITGKGAHVLIIDDPVKDAEEADSETMRENIWAWLKSTAYTRLAPNSGVLLIQTRWHDEDPAGKLETEMHELTQEAQVEMLENIEFGMSPEKAESVYLDKLEEFDHWEIVSYPAIAETDEWLNEDYSVTDTPLSDKSKLLRPKGEALHPDRYNANRLKRIYNSYRKSGQLRYWHALYQQRPVPDEGVFFLRSMLRTREMPELSAVRGTFPIITTWDLAVGVKQENDYSVKTTGYIDYEGSLNVVDVLRGRWESDELAKLVVSEYAKERPDEIGIEKGPTESAVMPLIRKEVTKWNQKVRKGGRKIAPAFREGKYALVPITDKRIRARPLQGMMGGGTLYFRKGATWFDDVKAELLRFDRGKFDDIVDALAWLARVALETATPVPKKVKRHKSWRDKLSKFTADGRVRDAMAA